MNKLTERGYHWIWELKQKLKVNIPQLLALAPNNDPFFCGTENDWKMGRWFEDVWKKFNPTHLRALHYLCGSGQVTKLDGTPYKFTEDDWKHLQDCSKPARYLGLVAADVFDDRRNGEPVLADWVEGEHEPTLQEVNEPSWFFPSIYLNFSSWRIPDPPDVTGYEHDDFKDRAFDLSIFIEKSTQDDILLPLCRELGINLYPSVGFQSVTTAVKLLKRVYQLGKPERVFYISDGDKQGRGMPKAVSRQIEFWLLEHAPGADVKLVQLALTDEQVRHYHLPRDEKGRVELDALEIFHPGELAKLVRQAVKPYIDETIGDELQDAEEEAQDLVNEEWSALMEPHERDLAKLHQKVAAVVKRYEKEVDGLNKRLQKELAPFEKPLKELEQQVLDSMNGFQPDLPERPEPTIGKLHEKEWLFDSGREYLEQLTFYQRHKEQGDPTEKEIQRALRKGPLGF